MNFLSRLQKIHSGCFKLCHDALGKYLPVAGNIGIFCQSDEEYEFFSKIREEETYPSDNPNQKYFVLKTPIQLGEPNKNSALYTHLYIRKPNLSSPEAGDIDFILSPEEYSKLKQRIIDSEQISGASIYDRPGWDTIELRNPEIDALAYISTQEMAEKVRVKFD